MRFLFPPSRGGRREIGDSTKLMTASKKSSVKKEKIIKSKKSTSLIVKSTMKAIFIAYNQAYYEEIAKMLNSNGVQGFTEWDEIKGHGSNKGEAHYGTHAWPTLNNAILTIVDDEKAQPILNTLKEQDQKTPELGLRAFCWNVESMI